MKVSSACLIIGTVAVNATVLPRHKIRDVPSATPKITLDTVPGLAVTPPQLYPSLFDSNGKLQQVTGNANFTAPKSLVADVQLESPRVFKDGALRKKIRYGPFRLPGTKEVNWQSKAMSLSGMTDVYLPKLEKPCSECMISALNADLEYANGTQTGSSAWLHHSVIITSGPNIRDPICNESSTETIFSSGNERSLTTYTSRAEGDVKAGYRMTSADSLTLVGEFKNELEEAQWVWLTIGYEYYDGPRPEFKDSHVAWLTIGQALRCGPKENPFGASNVTSKGVPKSLVFSEATKPWTTPFNFTILGVGGHLHDGGLSIDIYQNNQRICEAKANYAAGISGGMSHGSGEHIKSMTSCHLMTPAKAGDSFYLRANYDLTKYGGMKTDDGQLDEVMGVGTILMITEPKK